MEKRFLEHREQYPNVDIVQQLCESIEIYIQETIMCCYFAERRTL